MPTSPQPTRESARLVKSRSFFLLQTTLKRGPCSPYLTVRPGSAPDCFLCFSRQCSSRESSARQMLNRLFQPYTILTRLLSLHLPHHTTKLAPRSGRYTRRRLLNDTTRVPDSPALVPCLSDPSPALRPFSSEPGLPIRHATAPSSLLEKHSQQPRRLALWTQTRVCPRRPSRYLSTQPSHLLWLAKD